jgi:hypothetical protein
MQQAKDDVADIVIDEAPAPVEIDESPSVSDRESPLHLPSTLQRPVICIYI